MTEILELGLVFQDMLENLPALRVFQEILGKDFILGSYHSLVLFDGSSPETPKEGKDCLELRGMHTDFPYVGANLKHSTQLREP